jgi:Holliday junction resolvase RusA-like endonuclease
MNNLWLVIPGSIRSKKNSKRIYSCGRFKRVLPSKAYCEWEEQARKIIHKRNPLLTSDVTVEAHIYYSGQQPDLSGCMESLGDCLEGVIWENDRQIISWDGTRLYHDKNNPRTEIIVRWV